MSSEKRVGGRLCLDFVNTVRGWTAVDSAESPVDFAALSERLQSYSRLLGWALEAGAIPAATARTLAASARDDEDGAARVLRRAWALRAALYRLFRATIAGRAPLHADLDRVNDEWRRARARERLVAKRLPAGFGIGIEASADAELGAPLAAIVRSAVEVLASPTELQRVRYCPGEECGWLFLDTSRGGRRRWCDMSDCGNLDKVRRFRERSPG